MSTKKQMSLSQMANFVILMSRAWVNFKLGRNKQVVRLFNQASKPPEFKRTVFAGYQPTAHDVFICTYAKSGTYWTMQIALQIAHYGEAEFEHIHHLIPWPDVPVPVGIALDDPQPQRTSPTDLRVIKTHLESDYIPYSPQARYVVVIRDPKDAFVSSYYFHKALSPFKGLELPLDEFLELYLENESPYDSWVTHAASYWPWRTRENVLYLRFEDMKRDLRSAVLQIAQLMGVTLTEEQMQKVLEKSSFQYMKTLDHKFAPNIPMFVKSEDSPTLMRNGKSGNSHELLTQEQQTIIDQFCQSELRRLGSDMQYQW